MIISLIVAASDNNIIGKDNRLLWRLPNDMAFFKNTTWGMPVIMGRKTYESLGKPLKGRTNIIITNQLKNAPGAIIVSSIEDALKAAADTDAKECYIIGGGDIYRQTIPLAHKIYLTRVHAVLEGDTTFPVINEAEWRLGQVNAFDADDKHSYAYRFEIWQRK